MEYFIVRSQRWISDPFSVIGNSHNVSLLFIQMTAIANNNIKVCVCVGGG